MTTISKRPRDEKGQFTDSTPYAKRILAVRLFKEDDKKISEKAKKKGMTPTEIARIAIAEWLKQNE